MDKRELIKITSVETGISQTDVQRVINVVLGTVLSTIKKEEPVKIMGFGTFSVQVRKERKGYDLWEKKSVVIPERKVVKFTPSKLINLSK
ncbi:MULTISPECIES: HU family DNA-binding protein [Butyricimonas]|uniref:HU family DNA-binding protein n=1 Tax=Butyricimonas TaxID=574697 RepID=UPI0007FB5A60|nr:MULTISPECIES: HU family DNA-binding protein [Butyricimonas]